MESNAHFSAIDGTLLSDGTLYRQLVGSLIYLTITRPDIAYAVHIVNQFMTAPRTTYFTIVLRILRYVKGTMFHVLHFSRHSSLNLRAYSDACCFFLGDSLISWCSKKQIIVSHSSTEAEYRTLADTASELLWLH